LGRRVGHVRLVPLEFAPFVNTDPILFKIPLTDFDLSVLPIDGKLLQANPDLLREAVVQHLSERFEPFGGQTNIAVHDGQVTVSWTPTSGADSGKLFQYAVELLKRRAFAEAEAILVSLMKLARPPALTAFNLAMLWSDQGKVDEALALLKTEVEERPESADAWNALGIAYQRKGDRVRALEAIERSHEINPENPYTLRNLGALLASDDPFAGLPYLKKASELLPKDAAVAFGYGKALLECGHVSDADKVFERVVRLAPYTDLGERARAERTKLAEVALRKNGGPLRMDVVTYLTEAINCYRSLEPAQAQAAVYEIALLGAKGFDINNPQSSYVVQSLDIRRSGLCLLAYLYAGTKVVAPEQDVGVDFSREYAEAKRISGLGL
jgi:tetratricopeptide (TPR) repeat protein